MARIAAITVVLVAVVVAASAPGEIVKVTAERTQIYDSETKEAKSVAIEGKRFMVYGAGKDWYVVEMKIGGERAFRWIPKADVEVDWGKAKTETARVAAVLNPNTLKLEGGKLIQFAGITVVMEDTPLTRQTFDWLKRTLEGKEVVLEYDSKVGKNARGYEQAYVYAGGEFVNRTLVEYGLAEITDEYAGSSARYAEVFKYFSRQARDNAVGRWAGETPAAGAAPPEVQAETTQPAVAEHERTRTLTDAERAQWDRNLGVTIEVPGKRSKASSSQEECSDDGCDTVTTDEIVDARTLNLSVRNGWGFPLQGLKAKYDLFAKMGQTSDTVVLVKTAEITGMDIESGQTRQFTGETVEFKGTDSSKDGWKGRKYYGYRVTFVYQGAVVKVVAFPSSLADYGSSAAE
jgi:endonuclease YncB( thermonuclease family)